ncbi:MAG TPA: Gfo/Idh/MocA family oxidoreductase [Vicinamibacterales bacterium]|nr:Gfo/Idh/MocA family oxidoreductase [Vicinamibacterales bacterium]
MIKVALIGTGMVTLANHLPGVKRCPGAALDALCDTDPRVLAEAARASGISRTWTDPMACIRESGADAVIIATPNRVHHPIAMAAIAAGMHVLCEKPLAMTVAQAREMAAAADAAGVRHMTAFTYRFVPAIRYMKKLIDDGFVGQPWHFRAQRFQDWGRRFLGWRQMSAEAGTGEIGDMLSHRIDYAHLFVGPIARVVARTRRLLNTRIDAAGREHSSDLEDWVGCIVDFENGATGVLESTKVAVGHTQAGIGRDYCEVNGSEGTLVYELLHPHRVLGSRRGGTLEPMPVPSELLTSSSGPPEERVDPLQAFRWDQNAEFIAAIREGRPCVPSFHDGVRVQEVIEAIVRSAQEGRAIDVQRDAVNTA